MNRITICCFGVLTALLISLSGCRTPKTVEQAEETEEESRIAMADEFLNAAVAYRDIYERAREEKTLDSPETTAAIVRRLGERGYVAADTENRNRIDMANWEEAEHFCQLVKEGQPAAVSIFCIAGDGGFVRFDLESADGTVTVRRSVLKWENNSPCITWQNSYPAHDWTYTEEGYLFFDENYPEGYDGAPGYTAIRIQPLEEECRRLTSAYIAPVGYGANNLFLSDWSEKDFQNLDFNDLFPRLYPFVMKAPFPYETDFEGACYDVPEQLFETVILSCFSMDRDFLRTHAAYDGSTESYAYTTRSFYDAAISPNLPYPEVVAYSRNADQTITLTVNAVLPKQHLSQAFCHKVVVRPMEDGSFQFVFNHIDPSKTRTEMFWYADRLSEEERDRIYHGAD